jgi:ubiquinone/menaquinone biosynthesis C-methylase UbiE
MKDFIKKFWESQAVKHKSAQAASWSDDHAVNLEIDNIARFIKKGDVVLDVGCANGFAAFRQLPNMPEKIYGIDFSENMIKHANLVREEFPDKDKIEFSVGDVRHIRFEDNMFDLVYTTRVLINLPNWEDQQQGIRECLRVTRPGGIVIFSEAFWEPLVLLNALRALKQLPPLVEHDFNRYLKKERLEKLLASLGYEFECIDFSSIYYLGSRFLRELVTTPSDFPGYSNPINKIFYEIEKEYSGGGFGIQQAYVVQVPK